MKQDETKTQAMWGTLVASLETLHAGDIEGSLTYWADDGTVRLIGVQPIDPGTYVGKEQVRAWLSGLYNDHFVIEEELVAIEGDTVTVHARPGQTSHDDWASRRWRRPRYSFWLVERSRAWCGL